MVKSKYKDEKKAHEALLKLLKEHFTEDEDEILQDEDSDEMNPMNKFREMKDREMDEDFEEDDEDEESEGADDEGYEDIFDEREGGEDDEDEKKLSKDKRKDLAVLIVTKKSGRDKKRPM